MLKTLTLVALLSICPASALDGFIPLCNVTGNNTGVQFLKNELGGVGKWSVGGYQRDIHAVATNNAMLTELKTTAR